jgi:hypothetical protein
MRRMADKTEVHYPQAMTRFALVIPFAMLLSSCSHPGQDSHTEVFKTAQDAAADRLKQQLQAHKEQAISILRFSRPDIDAKPAEGTSITIAADGLTRSIDLAPIEEQLLAHQTEQRAILRKFLDEQLRPFDFDRLKSLGFAKVRSQITFLLVNDQTLGEMQSQAGYSPLLRQQIVTNLYRVAVVRTPGAAQGITVPATDSLSVAWQVSASEIDAEAHHNLRTALASAGDDLIETIAFGPRGKSGSIKSSVDPAIILLPDFVTAVQKSWNTTDNLVLFAPSPTGITFVEEHNQKLLDLLVPQWMKILVSTPSPLSSQLLLRDAQKISLFAYTPTTQPTPKPATRPTTYIVH